MEKRRRTGKTSGLALAGLAVLCCPVPSPASLPFKEAQTRNALARARKMGTVRALGLAGLAPWPHMRHVLKHDQPLGALKWTHVPRPEPKLPELLLPDHGFPA